MHGLKVLALDSRRYAKGRSAVRKQSVAPNATPRALRLERGKRNNAKGLHCDFRART